MESLPHSNTPPSFRSRRSHISLQHVSLAPLTSRFPLDDDDDDDGSYFDTFHSPQDDSEPPRRYAYSPHPATTSYLASVSVPTTPPLFSDSRNASYTNLSKRKSMARQKSDTNLDKMNSEQIRHHRRAKSYTHRPKLFSATARQDPEWLLRTGLALSSSTREEKGQSWLVKRDSSTSLVSEANPDDDLRRRSYSSYRGRSRRQRSGLSTPIALSRRPSSSHPASRLGSRVELSMTAAALERQDREVNASVTDDAVELVPDFVDDNLRNEMWSLGQTNTVGQRGVHGMNERRYTIGSQRSSTIDHSFSPSGSEFSDSETNEEDEVDEAEMQRLNRNCSLGLGRWIDSLVEWTLFSVEEEGPRVVAEPARQQRRVGDVIIQYQSLDEDHGNDLKRDPEGLEPASETTFERDAEELLTMPPIEKPGDQGGWSDVSWLLRVAKSVII
ncbi:hypothetical protein GX48_07414 [Paracoccidioides brasiliensis]|nr:hypothetical protein GX48_07414 [Paracoccidioides brasiliensis]